MLQTLLYVTNMESLYLLFIVRTLMFDSDQLLLSWIAQGCDNTYSTCFKLYWSPKDVGSLGRNRVLFW
jgi:hypothetical protein